MDLHLYVESEFMSSNSCFYDQIPNRQMKLMTIGWNELTDMVIVNAFSQMYFL